jgi:phage terminase large subunit
VVGRARAAHQGRAAPKRVGCFREFQKSIKDSVHRLLTDQIDLMELPGFA